MRCERVAGMLAALAAMLLLAVHSEYEVRISFIGHGQKEIRRHQPQHDSAPGTAHRAHKGERENARERKKATAGNASLLSAQHRRVATLAKLSTKHPAAKKGDAADAPYIFAHVGKGGGGSIVGALREYNLGQLFLHRACHPEPCIGTSKVDAPGAQKGVLINVREPVDRFVSAFNWALLRLAQCNRQQPCARFAKAKPLLNRKYHRGANQLAEALCARGDAAAQQSAREDLRAIPHLKDGLVSHLGGPALFKQLAQRDGFIVTAVPLEPGFDFDAQVVSALRYMVSQLNRTGVRFPERKMKELSAGVKNVLKHRSKNKTALSAAGSCAASPSTTAPTTAPSQRWPRLGATVSPPRLRSVRRHCRPCWHGEPPRSILIAEPSSRIQAPSSTPWTLQPAVCSLQWYVVCIVHGTAGWSMVLLDGAGRGVGQGGGGAGAGRGGAQGRGGTWGW
jgi:hypothetical protein